MSEEIMKSKTGLTGHPMDHGWVPHEPSTWPYKFADLKEETAISKWNGHDSEPEFDEAILPAGTRVKIVMVSRMGDVGISENLKHPRGTAGYVARVELDELTNFSNEKLG